MDAIYIALSKSELISRCMSPSTWWIIYKCTQYHTVLVSVNTLPVDINIISLKQTGLSKCHGPAGGF